MSNYNLVSDLMTTDPSTVKRNKKKINELLNKYGSREAILQNADLADSINYDFAHGDDLIDEVLKERALTQNNQTLQSNPLQPSQTALAREAKNVRDAYRRDEETDENIPQPTDGESDSARSENVRENTQDNDNAFIKLMGENLVKTENMKSFIYLDKYGHITAGIGKLLDNETAFKSMNWEIDGRKASKSEVNEAYNLFTSLQQEKDSEGKPKYRNYTADYFKKFSKLRLSEDSMTKMLNEHLSNNLKQARYELKEFDSLPSPLRLIILDFYYNKGNIKRQEGFISSLKSRDKKAFKKAIIRGLPHRDKWALEQFNQIPESFWK